MNITLCLARNVNNENHVLGGKRILKIREVELVYTNIEFENILVYGIYKSGIFHEIVSKFVEITFFFILLSMISCLELNL